MTTIAWKRFASDDWDAFCGAESFPGGGAPWLADLSVDGEYAVAILDASGLQLVVGDDLDVWCDGGANATSFEALGALRPEMTSLGLRALGVLPVGDVLDADDAAIAARKACS